MIELSRHIECLLVKHNCVIIPGLGGFVTQYVPARLIQEESLYLPPYRSIGFNSELLHNDGLLIQSYMQAYDTNYSETLGIIGSAVQQMKSELQERGFVEMSGIGRLLLGTNGNYDFEPYESGVVAPELYGLDSFAVSLRPADELKREKAKEKKNRAKESKRHIRVAHKNERNYTLRINREFVNYVAAAIVAIAFYFAWAVPVNITPGDTVKQASVFTLPQPQPEVVLQAEKQESSVDAVSPQPQVVAIAENPEAPTQIEDVDTYTIVLMSAVSLKNAKAAIESYNAEGYSEVYLMNTKMVRVAFGNYASPEAAEADLQRVRECTKVPTAWVMKVKN